MEVCNVHLVSDAGAQPCTIAVEGERISAVTPRSEGRGRQSLTFTDVLAFPGLINSHDHLDFSLMPLTGGGPYADYRDWAAALRDTSSLVIRVATRVPAPLRYLWGACRNLLAGVTTVVHHGQDSPARGLAPLDILLPRCLHSVAYEPRWMLKLLLARGGPVAIHLGEGTDERARREVRQFLRWNLARRDTVAVHGICMEPAQARRFKGLVWCPDSNLRLYARTADVSALRDSVPILFGTDSPLTASGDIWEQLRHAREACGVDSRLLYEALTTSAADAWGLRDRGRVAPGMLADIVVARKKRAGVWESFDALAAQDILAVIRRGRLVLYDATLDCSAATPAATRGRFHAVELAGTRKFVAFDLPALAKRIQRHRGVDLNLPLRCPLAADERDC